MRLVVYNIRYGTGTGLSYHFPVPFSGSFRNSQNRFQDIKKFLNTLNPDIMGLVEVDGGSYRHGGICQAQEMASFMGGESSFTVKYKGPNITKMPILGSQGNAVISRINSLYSTSHDLERGMKRNALEVSFEDFSLVLVHLPLGKTSRSHQLGKLKNIYMNRKKPMIIAGDYNTLNGSHELDLLLGETGLQNANVAGTPTFPCKRPRKELDFILASPDIRINKFDIPHVDLSDHLPLVCDFDIMSSETQEGVS